MPIAISLKYYPVNNSIFRTLIRSIVIYIPWIAPIHPLNNWDRVPFLENLESLGNPLVKPVVTEV